MDRVQAYGVSTLAQALALASGGSVTLLSHPSLRGINSGSGYSGSTAWHDAFRFRQYLRAAQENEDEDELVDPGNDTGLRELSFMKNQYGPPCTKLTLRWRNGLFLPESGGGSLHSKKLAEETNAEAAFLDLLDRFREQGRNVGATPNSPNAAPATFAKENCGFTRKQLDAAMRRLFAAHTIHVESYRQDGHSRQRLARVKTLTAPLTAPLTPTAPDAHSLPPSIGGECAPRAVTK